MFFDQILSHSFSCIFLSIYANTQLRLPVVQNEHYFLSKNGEHNPMCRAVRLVVGAKKWEALLISPLLTVLHLCTVQTHSERATHMDSYRTKDIREH